MKKRIKLSKGFTTGRDKCRVGAVLNDLSKDLLLDPAETPLEALEKGLSSEGDHLEIPYLCLESDHLKEKGVVSVKVYDYLRGGDCILDINYKDKIDSFLKGCQNLANAILDYFEKSQAQLEEVVQKD
ncbi:MAG: hypothetical protein N2654_03350 [Deltaproteobacteria bacterium]|nr:hypothetical protein [Deltaproteobacteria bacterium]MCX7952653.1 hypothetical protein [Deltaproteobacteria bacterium]